MLDMPKAGNSSIKPDDAAQQVKLSLCRPAADRRHETDEASQIYSIAPTNENRIVSWASCTDDAKRVNENYKIIIIGSMHIQTGHKYAPFIVISTAWYVITVLKCLDVNVHFHQSIIKFLLCEFLSII